MELGSYIIEDIKLTRQRGFPSILILTYSSEAMIAIHISAKER